MAHDGVFIVSVAYPDANRPHLKFFKFDYFFEMVKPVAVSSAISNSFSVAEKTRKVMEVVSGTLVNNLGGYKPASERGNNFYEIVRKRFRIANIKSNDSKA